MQASINAEVRRGRHMSRWRHVWIGRETGCRMDKQTENRKTDIQVGIKIGRYTFRQMH